MTAVQVGPGTVDDDVLLARAFLSRVAEPACVPLWAMTERHGPVVTADSIRDGSAPADVLSACAARASEVDPHADLAAAHRHGIRLVVPESPDWPAFGLACLYATGRRRVAQWQAGDRKRFEGGEPVPPLALWVRGPLDLSALAVRSVGLVGSRAATIYGEQVAAELGYALAERDVTVVSGGAFGIDAAAHRGALGADGHTVIVSAGGLDRPYPPGNARLFDRVAQTGLVLAESPPGSIPRRQRFLTRNRLIAALSTGTVVVEAAARSGARNTARHCVVLGRPLMAVPGPVTSAASAGCHALLTDQYHPALLVTGWRDVLAVVGSLGDVPAAPVRPGAGSPVTSVTARDWLRDELDRLDPVARQVFDGLPAASAVGIDRLAVLSGLRADTVMQALPDLEVSGLVEASGGQFRVGSRVRAAARERAPQPARPASVDRDLRGGAAPSAGADPAPRSDAAARPDEGDGGPW